MDALPSYCPQQITKQHSRQGILPQKLTLGSGTGLSSKYLPQKDRVTFLRNLQIIKPSPNQDAFGIKVVCV